MLVVDSLHVAGTVIWRDTIVYIVFLPSELLPLPLVGGGDAWNQPTRGGRPKLAEKHAKEPDFSRISSASLRLEPCCQESGDFAARSHRGQLGLAEMSAFLLANST